MSSTTATPTLRWSSVKDCGRKAVFGAIDAPARERSDREHRILFRGRSMGRDYGDFLAARDGEAALEREVKVEWEFGTGHIDLFHLPTETAIEVLSSAHASEQMVTSKLLQLVGYLEHFPRAKAGLLVVLNPADFSEERFPVARGTDAYQALVEQMQDRIGQLERWRDENVLPDRVCRKPSEAIGRFCLHAEHCFAGWDPPEPDGELAGVEAERAADRVFNLKIAERQAKEAYDGAQAVRKAAEAELANMIDRPGSYAVGPWTVVRTDVNRKPTLDTRKAELAGVLNVEALSEFFKPGASYSTWKVTRTEFPGTADVPDFGEDAPF